MVVRRLRRATLDKIGGMLTETGYVIAATAIALVTSALTGMGVGSAGVLVAFLTLAAGVPQLEAQLINMIFFIAASASAVTVNAIKRRIVWRPVICLAVLGSLGSLCGAVFAHSVSSDQLGKAFGAIMSLCGGMVLFRNFQKKK